MIDEYLNSTREDDLTELENYIDRISILVFDEVADLTILPDIVEKGMTKFEVAQAYILEVLDS